MQFFPAKRHTWVLLELISGVIPVELPDSDVELPHFVDDW